MLDVTTANLGWYIALTEPSREITTASRLVSLRFQCYLPTFIKSVWAGRSRRRLVTRPLFPGYLFIGMVRGDEQWERIRKADVGARDFLKISGHPVTVPYAAIEAIKIKEGELLLPPKQRSSYRKGQQVRIMEGPFSAFLGPIERLNGKGRVDVMVNVFGRMVPLNLHEMQIEAVA